jgi:hypothetical protein
MGNDRGYHGPYDDSPIPEQPTLLASLQRGISDRQKELREMVSILGQHAFRLQRMSNWLKVATIVLSAVTTAKGVADKAFGDNALAPLLIFTALGIITTAAIGIEAAFKLEKRAADLNLLSAATQATVITVDSEWRKNIGSVGDSDLRVAARDLLTMQDAKLTEIHQKAATAGIHLTLEVRDLEEPSDSDRRVPYTA